MQQPILIPATGALPPSARLQADGQRASCIARRLACGHWRRLQRAGLSTAALQQFHARFKYLVMAHSVAVYRELGPLLADPGKGPLAPLAEQLIDRVMAALQRPPTRAGYANALAHVAGYLKGKLTAPERAELARTIERYRRGELLLGAPLALLRRHFRRHPHPYISEQVLLWEYAEALAPRNTL